MTNREAWLRIAEHFGGGEPLATVWLTPAEGICLATADLRGADRITAEQEKELDRTLAIFFAPGEDDLEQRSMRAYWMEDDELRVYACLLLAEMERTGDVLDGEGT